MKSKKYFIFYITLLMIALVYVVGEMITENQKFAKITPQTINQAETSVLAESEIFERDRFAPRLNSIGSKKTLAKFYENRAYAGAPPTIPHPLTSEFTIGSQSCLQCHLNGEYVSKWNAFAPTTPHPQFESCLQCHVPSTTQTKFKNNFFLKVLPQATKLQATIDRPVGSPPQIPHSLKEKVNCLSCHAGPATPIQIRTTHPERVNCLQCHVPNQTSIATRQWKRTSLN